MPLNFHHIYRQLEQRLPNLRKDQEARREHLERALESLYAWTPRAQDITKVVHEAAKKDPNLRAALPTEEPLNACIPPANAPAGMTFLASDGSQIFPDHHRALFYGVVNIGLVLVAPDRAARFVESTLLLDEDFHEDDFGPEEQVHLARTVGEHAWLAAGVCYLRGCTTHPKPERLHALREAAWPRLAADAPLLALVDGPLEIWGIRDVPHHKELIARVLTAWDELREHAALLAGYVDRPRAAPVLTALALAEQVQKANKVATSHDLRFPWPGVLDATVFARLLPPGYRSALFRLVTGTMQKYYGAAHALYFFYLNMGTKDRPLIARVEIPAWVAEDGAKVNAVHGALWEHGRAVEAARYPYILHQAHAAAVVREKERAELERLLQRAYLEEHLHVGRPSPKQRLKDRMPR